ncbi:hypothetical protein L3V82_13085 [Thiotrichales bacterium 19S3-7]|nr:hypothetical protein [Thiotrichales bacterium 19S3-7]MCF6803105.1 hypothetical protein [Thiotrichales bacterium 19S3-11]
MPISSQQAKESLIKYGKTIEAADNLFSKNINSNFELQHVLRADHYFFKEILKMLTAIANNTNYTPHKSNSGLSNINFSPDPQEALKCAMEMLVKYYVKAPQLSQYSAKLNQLAQDLETAIHSTNVTIYKSKNNELAVKFYSQALRDKFIESIGGYTQYPATDKHNGGKQFLLTYSNNLTTLYISGTYKAKNDEFAVTFPSLEIRSQFCKLLNLSGKDEIARIYTWQDPLYFNKKLYEENSNFKCQYKLEYKVEKKPPLNFMSASSSSSSSSSSHSQKI